MHHYNDEISKLELELTVARMARQHLERVHSELLSEQPGARRETMLGSNADLTFRAQRRQREIEDALARLHRAKKQGL